MMEATRERSSPTPISPQEFPPEVVWDLPMPGFGIGAEFENLLNEAWEKHERTKDARLEKYARFGMGEEDARRRSPDDMRERYNKHTAEQLAEFEAGTPTPTPSPSPSAPLTPHSFKFDSPKIAEWSPSKRLFTANNESRSRPAALRGAPSHQHPKQQPTPEYAASQPTQEHAAPRRPSPMLADRKRQGDVVVGSRIEKKRRGRANKGRVGKTPRATHPMKTRGGRANKGWVGKTPRATHHMKTRSRRATKNGGSGFS